jgi:hypothetical protein
LEFVWNFSMLSTTNDSNESKNSLAGGRGHIKFLKELRFQVLTASTKMTVFWVFVPCSLVEVYRCFRGACCLNTLMMEAASTSEMSVNYQTTHWNNPEGSQLLKQFSARQTSFNTCHYSNDWMLNTLLLFVEFPHTITPYDIMEWK